MFSRDGTEHPVANAGAPIRTGDGEIAGTVLVFRDTTIERSIEKYLRESEEKFRKAFNTSSDAININRVDRMDQETLKRAFEPFFTTKPKGSGTVSTLYGIVKQNNGFINVASKPGSVSTFEIYFPRCLGEVKIEKAAPAAAVVGGTETILVVEDQPDLLELTQMTLESQGYTVITAPDPGAALLLDEIRIKDIDLLVTDVIMPVMSGKELSDRLKNKKSRVKTLFMSGYTADMLSPQGVLQDKSEFLQKPFTREELSEHVRVVLSK